jgi:hypothetical protein
MARVGLSSNRKFLRLARALGNKALARGVLEVLWEPCFECGDPYIGTATDIEAVCDWQGKPGALTQALLDAGAPKGAGFIEPYEGTVRDSSEPHYQIHDFFHHCPEYARTRRERETEATEPKVCAFDGKTYYSRKHDSLYCSQRCRQAAYEQRLRNSAIGQKSALTGIDRSLTSPDSTPTPTPTPTPRVQNARGLYAGSSEALTRSEPAVITIAIADDPLVLTFPTIGVDGTEWYLNQGQVDQWAELYDGVNVLEECKKAWSWISADKQRRKTKRGMLKFLVAWLNRVTDSRRSPSVITGSLKTAGNQEALRRFVEEGERK